MKDFALYIESWMVYIALGLLLLFLIDLKARGWRFGLRIGILSFIAAGIFTPQTVINSDTYAPLILNCLLNAEIEGVTAIYEGLITLTIVWAIIFTVSLGIRHLFLAKRKASSENKTEPSLTKSEPIETQPKES